jgi:hypothetical protein
MFQAQAMANITMLRPLLKLGKLMIKTHKLGMKWRKLLHHLFASLYTVQRGMSLSSVLFGMSLKKLTEHVRVIGSSRTDVVSRLIPGAGLQGDSRIGEADSIFLLLLVILFCFSAETSSFVV